MKNEKSNRRLENENNLGMIFHISYAESIFLSRSGFSTNANKFVATENYLEAKQTIKPASNRSINPVIYYDIVKCKSQDWRNRNGMRR